MTSAMTYFSTIFSLILEDVDRR